MKKYESKIAVIIPCYNEEKEILPMSEPHYDVFLSYAHADAYTEEQKKIVVFIKNAIEEALKSVAGNDSCVFLDSEALKWGDEWGVL